MNFPGCLVVRILGFHCYGPVSVTGQGTELLQAAWCSQKKKREKIKKMKKKNIGINVLMKQSKYFGISLGL